MRFATAMVLLLAFVGCSNESFEKEKSIVKNSLKDPESATFQNLRPGKSAGSVCGELNAKNSMGGYVGFQPFLVMEGVAYIQPVGSCSTVSDLAVDTLAHLSQEELVARAEQLKNDMECQKQLVEILGRLVSECEEPEGTNR